MNISLDSLISCGQKADLCKKVCGLKKNRVRVEAA